MTQSQVADMREKVQKESLADSKHKAYVLINTMFVACYGVAGRLPRAIVDEYKATVSTGSQSSPV